MHHTLNRIRVLHGIAPPGSLPISDHPPGIDPLSSLQRPGKSLIQGLSPLCWRPASKVSFHNQAAIISSVNGPEGSAVWPLQLMPRTFGATTLDLADKSDRLDRLHKIHDLWNLG